MNQLARVQPVANQGTPETSKAVEQLKTDQHYNEKGRLVVEPRVQQSLKELAQVMAPMQFLNKMTQELHQAFAGFRQALQSKAPQQEKPAANAQNNDTNSGLFGQKKGAAQLLATDQKNTLPTYEAAKNDLLLADEHLPTYKQALQQELLQGKLADALPLNPEEAADDGSDKSFSGHSDREQGEQQSSSSDDSDDAEVEEVLPTYEEAANDTVLADEHLPDYEGAPQEYTALKSTSSWSDQKEQFSINEVSVNPKNGWNVRKVSFGKQFSQENIFFRIQMAFEELRNLQQVQLASYVDNLEANTKLARSLTEYANYLSAKYIELQGEIDRLNDKDHGGAPPLKKFKWAENPDAKRTIENIVAFMKQHELKINGVDVDKWIHPKDDANPNGGVKEEGVLTESELFLFSETLKNEAQKKTDFNVQLQTRVTATTQTYTNYQEALITFMTTSFKMVRNLIDQLNRV